MGSEMCIRDRYYQAAPWVFAVAYTLFGLAVVASWVKVRPRSFRGREALAN